MLVVVVFFMKTFLMLYISLYQLNGVSSDTKNENIFLIKNCLRATEERKKISDFSDCNNEIKSFSLSIVRMMSVQ